jgi:iron-sulfur cluster assembly protein
VLSLTARAAAQVLAQAAAAGGEEACLRIAAREEAGGEIVFGLGFDEPRSGDAQVESEGVTLLVAPASQELLDGVVIDWVEVEPGAYRFVFARADAP